MQRLVPESPRWLMAHNKTKEAFLVFEKIAKSNGNSLDDLNELRKLNTLEGVVDDLDFTENHESKLKAGQEKKNVN